jgi:hypothetical protein
MEEYTMKKARPPISLAGSQLGIDPTAAEKRDGILQQNPFFVPPEELLREVRGRRAMWTTSPSTAA